MCACYVLRIAFVALSMLLILSGLPCAESVSLRSPSRSAPAANENSVSGSSSLAELEEEEDSPEEGDSSQADPAQQGVALVEEIPQQPHLRSSLTPLPTVATHIVAPVLLDSSNTNFNSLSDQTALTSTPGEAARPLAPLARKVVDNYIRGQQVHPPKTDSSQLMAMPKNWPPKPGKSKECDPPCIGGRGVCNDKICFCKSPYTGSNCQHKIQTLYRASYAMVVGFSIFSFLIGIILAKALAALIATVRNTTSLDSYGTIKTKMEQWVPPQQSKGGGAK
jgi:hypothetical protein